MRTSSSGSSICIDFHVKPNDKAAAICNGAGVLGTTPCEREKALGGCERGNLTNWYFTSSQHTTPEDVKKTCGSSKFVPAVPSVTAAR